MQVLADREGCIYLGPAASFERFRLDGAIDELVVDADRRRAMSQVGTGLVDGRGTERVAIAMLGFR